MLLLCSGVKYIHIQCVLPTYITKLCNCVLRELAANTNHEFFFLAWCSMNTLQLSLTWSLLSLSPSSSGANCWLARYSSWLKCGVLSLAVSVCRNCGAELSVALLTSHFATPRIWQCQHARFVCVYLLGCIWECHTYASCWWTTFLFCLSTSPSMLPRLFGGIFSVVSVRTFLVT